MTKTSPKKLRRAIKGRKVAGLAMGLANYFNMDVVVIRSIWVLLFIPGGLPGLVPYLLLWLIVPEED
jgi:phage shock protein C